MLTSQTTYYLQNCTSIKHKTKQPFVTRSLASWKLFFNLHFISICVYFEPCEQLFLLQTQSNAIIHTSASLNTASKTNHKTRTHTYTPNSLEPNMQYKQSIHKFITFGEKHETQKLPPTSAFHYPATSMVTRSPNVESWPYGKVADFFSPFNPRRASVSFCMRPPWYACYVLTMG